MPTEEMIERGVVGALNDIDMGHLAKVGNPYLARLPPISALDLRRMVEGALLAALPTPEEHARGIEAAVNRLREEYGIYAEAALAEAISAYLSAVGLAP